MTAGCKRCGRQSSCAAKRGIAPDKRRAYRASDGIYAVGHIENGDFAQTHSGSGFTPGWTHIVASVIFYRAGDGIAAVGHVGDGVFKNTQSSTGFTSGWTYIVSVGDLGVCRQRLAVSRYTTADISEADADRITADSSTVLQTKDGPDDIACPVQFVRDGGITVFETGDGSIDTAKEFDTVVGLPGQVKVVNEINFCGGLKPSQTYLKFAD